MTNKITWKNEISLYSNLVENNLSKLIATELMFCTDIELLIMNKDYQNQIKTKVSHK